AADAEGSSDPKKTKQRDWTIMNTTKTLAEWITSNRLEDIPQDVRKEARRALLNYVGCAIGGAQEDAANIALRTLAPYSGPAIAAVLGRSEKLDPLRASVINGIT